jgi:ParB-like chromosome segregation protein Spo0J
MDLKIEYVPIDSIKPYSKNAKLHPAEQIEQIKKSIQEFGFKDPLATWHGEVMAGNGRLQAAKELGMKELPIVRLDDLTDEQRRAYALVHNKLTMNSPFDDSILSEELENILVIDMCMFDLGEVFDDSTTKTQTFTGGELNTEDFSDDKFNTVCPVCGFKFNAEGK